MNYRHLPNIPWFVAVVLVLLAGPVTAGELFPEVYNCPVDGTVVNAQRMLATNALGGTDSDFCQYAKGGNAREHGVATCPTCFYSAMQSKFEQPLDEGQKKALLEMLATARDNHTTVDQLEPWDRYQLAALCAGVLDENALERGDLLLSGAWTIRDRIVGFIPQVDGPVDVFNGLAEMDKQWLELTDLRAQQKALFDLARVAHRGGFPARRDAYLARLDELQPVPEDLASGRERWMYEPIEMENRFLDKALQHYEEGLAAGSGSAEERVYYAYLVVDLKRRLGRTDGLDRDLNLLLAEKTLPEHVKVAIKSLKHVLAEGAL